MKPLEVEEIVEDALAEDSDLEEIVGDRIFRYAAPMAANLPFVVFSIHSAKDELGVGAAVVMTSYEVIVRVVGNIDDLTNLETAADRFDAVLLGGYGQGYQVARLAPVTYVTVENGQYYRHLGSRYLIEG